MARFAYWKLPQGFEGSLKNSTVFFVVKVMRVCVSMMVGTREPDFKYILSSLNSVLSFPCQKSER